MTYLLPASNVTPLRDERQTWQQVKQQAKQQVPGLDCWQLLLVVAAWKQRAARFHFMAAAINSWLPHAAPAGFPPFFPPFNTSI